MYLLIIKKYVLCYLCQKNCIILKLCSVEHYITDKIKLHNLFQSCNSLGNNNEVYLSYLLVFIFFQTPSSLPKNEI